MSVRRNLTLVACVATGVTAPAVASPRSDPTTGRAVFTGATSPSPTSITLNPAALGLGNVGELLLAVTTVIDRVSIDRTGASTADSTVTELGPGAELGVIFHPADRFTVGVDVRTPPSEQFPAGEQALRYHTLGGRQRNYIASIAASLRVTNFLFVGASLSHDNTLLRLQYARDTALANGHGPNGIDSDCGGSPCGFENPLASETYDVHARSSWLSTSNLRINVGFVLQLHKDVLLAVAYHTPPGLGIENELNGTADVALAPRDGGDILHGQSTVLVSYPAGVDTELRARLPALLDLRVGGRWEDLSRFRGYDVRTYKHNFPDYGIPEWTERPRGFHDPFALWAGVEQVDVGQELRFGGRIGIETSSVDDYKTSPLTIAPTSFTLDGGLQWRPRGGSWMVQLSYGLQLSRPVKVVAGAYDPNLLVECIDSEYDYSTNACRAARAGFANDSAAGTYTKMEHALRLALRYEFP